MVFQSLWCALVVSLLTSFASHAESAACANPGDKGCMILGDEDQALGLLQQKASTVDEKKLAPKLADKKQTPYVNSTAVWEQLKGAVQIDELQEKIANTTDSQEVAKLKEQLANLQDNFPSAAEVKEQFAGQWDKITSSVDAENVQAKLAQAKSAGCSNIPSGYPSCSDLEAKYKSLKSQLGDFSIQDVQGKAAEYWGKLQAAGESLPDLTGLQDQISDAANQAAAAASSAADAVKGWFR